MAISHCGVGEGHFIADFDERSPEANACRQWFDVALEELQRETDWTFATKSVALALVSDEDEAYTQAFYYAYRTPSDCVRPRRIISGVEPDTLGSLISFKVTVDDDGGLILTNTEDAELEYSFLQTDTQRLPMDFCVALSYRLGAYIAPRFMRDVGKLQPLVEKLYAFSLSKAKATDQNSQRVGPAPDAEWIGL
jgi:hypothetical protein